jgi:hypothetical protein
MFTTKEVEHKEVVPLFSDNYHQVTYERTDDDGNTSRSVGIGPTEESARSAALSNLKG